MGKALFRICYVRPRYRSRVGDISKFFSYIKDEVLIDKQNDIPDIIAKILSDTAVTNVSTSEDTQQSSRKPFQRTMYSGFEEYKQIQIENAPKNQVAKLHLMKELRLLNIYIILFLVVLVKMIILR